MPCENCGRWVEGVDCPTTLSPSCKCEELSTQPNYSMPVAWLHIMDNTDGIKDNEPMKELTFSRNNPFGIPGKDYDENYKVTSKPLYLKA